MTARGLALLAAVALVVGGCGGGGGDGQPEGADAVPSSTSGPPGTVGARDVSEQVRRDGFEAFMRTLLACMRDRGFHPRVVDDPAVEFDGPGVNVDYDPGETEDPEFETAHADCHAEGQAAERQAYRLAESEGR